MSFRKTVKWLLILLVLIGLAGGGYVGWLYTQTNELLQDAIHKKLAEIAPEWDMQIGRARFDWNRRVHVYNATVKARGQGAVVLTLPEIILTLDREKLSRTQEVEIRKIRIVGAVADLVRDRHGRWNYEPLLKLKLSDRPLPEWDIEQAAANVTLERPGGEAATVALRSAAMQLIPSARRQFVIRGTAAVERIGTLQLDGQWNIDAKAWTLNGRMHDVTASGPALALAAGASPALHAKLVRADDLLRRAGQEPVELAAPAGTQWTTISQRTVREEPSDDAVPPAPLPSSVPDFGMQGSFDLDFQWGSAPEAGSVWKCLLTARQAQIAHAALPFPLRDVHGKIYWDGARLILRNVRAGNGATQLWLDGEYQQGSPHGPGRLNVRITNLVFDERLRGRLPAGVRRVYDAIRPKGQADVSVTFVRDAADQWTTEDFRLTAKGCAVTYEKFAYEAGGLVGTVEQRGPALYVATLDGQAGGRPVTLRGWLRDPGPAAEVVCDIAVHDLPLDRRLIDACPRAAEEILETLRLEGTASGSVRLYRAPGLYQEFETRIAARLKDCSLEYTGFPYRLSHLTGDVRFDSVADQWTFTDLRAAHGTAELTGTGWFRMQPQPQLALAFQARGVQLDKHLELALPEDVRDVWTSLAPSGRADARAAIRWTPGGPVVVDVPEAEIHDAALRLTAFPWPVDRIHARLAWHHGAGRLDIHQFTGWHDQTRLAGAGFALCAPDGGWRVHLNPLHVDDLQPSPVLLAALPPDLRRTVQTLDPQGPLSAAGEVEFRGTCRPQDPVTAAWDVKTVLTGGRITTGTVLENVHGEVSARGSYDGAQVRAGGRIDLSSVQVFGHQLTQVRGPWELEGTQLTVGARETLRPLTGETIEAVPLDRRITARAFGEECVLTLDAAASLVSEPSYHLLVTVSQARLEEYAKRYLGGATDLAGIVNGWVDLHGRGDRMKQVQGRGKVQISPAALYELPIIVQMFQVLSLGPPDKTAFKYAFADFTVRGGELRFHLIDLVGDTISFRGHGDVKFTQRMGDGRIDLDFYSRMPRNLVPIPLVRYVVNPISEAMTGWVGIEVEGTVSDPVARLKPAPALDEAMRRFLSAFEQAPRNVPRFIVPTLVPLLPQPAPEEGAGNGQ